MNRAPGGDDFILSLKSVTAVILRRFWIILLAVIFTVGLAITLSFLQTPQYEASVRMLVGQDQGITNSPTEAVGLQQLTQTMAVAADSRPVADAVIEEFNLDMSTEDFFDNLTVEQVASTQFIEISYLSPDPQEAQRIADATGEAFSQQISEVSDGSAPITAVLYERAEAPDEPVVPDFFRNGALALVFGLMLGAGMAFLLELLDDRWSSPEEAENMLDVPVFGVIPVFDMASGEDSEKIRATLDEPHPDVRREAGPALLSSASGTSDGSRPGSDGMRLPSSAGEESVIWPVGMALLDGEGRVDEADATLLGMFGRGSEEVIGRDFAGLFSHPDDAKRHRELHESLVKGEWENYSMEKRITGGDGQITWVEVTVSSLRDKVPGRPGAMVMVENISRLKQAEEAANFYGEAKRLSEDRLRTIMGNSPLSVSFFTPDGYSLSEDESWNSLWHDLWYEPGETNGESVLENERVKGVGLDRYFRQSLDSRSETVTPPLRLQSLKNRGEGENGERWLRVFIRPVTDEGGDVREVMMMFEELTDHKPGRDEGSTPGQLEAALRQREETLQKAEEKGRRLEEKLEVVSMEKMEIKRRLMQMQQDIGANRSSSDSL